MRTNNEPSKSGTCPACGHELTELCQLCAGSVDKSKKAKFFEELPSEITVDGEIYQLDIYRLKLGYGGWTGCYVNSYRTIKRVSGKSVKDVYLGLVAKVKHEKT